MPKAVTDPALLAQLNAGSAPAGKQVSDPALLEQLNTTNWSDVPGEALRNLPSSAGNFVSDIAQPFLHPIDTATSLGNLGAGVLEKTGLKSGDEHVQYADAVGQYFKDRYGSVEGFKKALAKDPVGVAGDLSALFTGGESLAAKLPGTAAKVAAKAAGTAGRVLDPLNLVTGPAAGAMKAADFALGTTTGVGADAIAAARQAGREGGQASEALTSQMRKTAPIEDIVTDAKAAADQMKADAQARYRQGMAATKANPTQLSFRDVDAALQRVDNIVNFHGVPRADLAPLQERMTDLVNTWKSGDPQYFHTPEGFDELKKRIHEDVLGGIPYEQGAARKIAGDVYGAVKDTIVRQDPTYAKTMAEYEKYRTALDEIQKTLSLNPKATVDTSLRKLTSIMRNNVNSSFGRRNDLVQMLQDAGAPQLTNKIAGATLNSWEPRGLAKAAGGGELLYSLGNLLHGDLSSLGTMGATLAAGSPRLVGEGSHALGVAQRFMDTYGKPVRPLAEAARQAGRIPRVMIDTTNWDR